MSVLLIVIIRSLGEYFPLQYLNGDVLFLDCWLPRPSLGYRIAVID
jgi:hypothetical protein